MKTNLSEFERAQRVLVGGVNRSALMALRYARSVGPDDLVAVTVAIDDDHAERIRADWDRFGLSIPLEVLASPYRDLTGVVLAYLDAYTKMVTELGGLPDNAAEAAPEAK